MWCITVLLLQGGHVVYHGAASSAMDYLAAALPSLDTDLYENPGDFIIDAVSRSSEGRV